MNDPEDLRRRANALIEEERQSWHAYWQRNHAETNPIIRVDDPTPDALFERVCAPAFYRNNGNGLGLGRTVRVQILRACLGVIDADEDAAKVAHAWNYIAHLLDTLKARQDRFSRNKRELRRQRKLEAYPHGYYCGREGCAEVIPALAHGRQRFCSTRCRVAAHRAKS